MNLRNIFMSIALICINSPIYSQTDIYELKQIQFKSTDLVFQRLPETLRERLQPPLQIINNPYWPNHIDVYGKVSNDFFITKPFDKSGYNNMVFNNNGSKVLVGVIYGFLIGMAGALIGSAIGGGGDSEIDREFNGALIGGLIAYHLGTPYGVYRVGNRNNEDGSYGAAFAGGIVGHLTGVAALTVSQNTATGVYWFISAPIGATIGYNISR